MEWKGKTLNTMAEVCSAVVECDSKEEAQEFMRIFEAQDKFLKYDLGYWTGNLDAVTQDRIWDWFNLEHPFFCGKRHPPVDEIQIRGFLTGMRSAYPQEERLATLEKMIVGYVVDMEARQKSRLLLLKQLLQCCYNITRKFGKEGDEGYNEFRDMVLFVRKLLKDEGRMFIEEEPCSTTN